MRWVESKNFSFCCGNVAGVEVWPCWDWPMLEMWAAAPVCVWLLWVWAALVLVFCGCDGSGLCCGLLDFCVCVCVAWAALAGVCVCVCVCVCGFCGCCVVTLAWGWLAAVAVCVFVWCLFGFGLPLCLRNGFGLFMATKHSQQSRLGPIKMAVSKLCFHGSNW